MEWLALITAFLKALSATLHAVGGCLVALTAIVAALVGLRAAFSKLKWGWLSKLNLGPGLRWSAGAAQAMICTLAFVVSTAVYAPFLGTGTRNGGDFVSAPAPGTDLGAYGGLDFNTPTPVHDNDLGYIDTGHGIDFGPFTATDNLGYVGGGKDPRGGVR